MSVLFRRSLIVLVIVALMGAGAGYWLGAVRIGVPPSPQEQACALPSEWLELTKRGYFEGHSGQVAILPRTPAYMASAAGGWSHSGPWPYLQRVPLVFYGPGIVPATGDVDRPVTLADVAPTLAVLLKGSMRADGGVLDEVARFDVSTLSGPRPRLILTIVLDGGGRNTLEQWPQDWPNLARMMSEGVSYTDAVAGSSPSVTPAVHTTLGTGFFPSKHGITSIRVRDEGGEVQDAFFQGESSRFIQVPTLAERWDEQTGGRALVGMVGYEPWHLGMIGKGAERPGGDADHAAWLNVETNEWITNPAHYELPAALVATGGLEDDLTELDGADGNLDRAWGDHEILDDPARVEETPAFIRYHARALIEMIKGEGYGEDRVTDLLFTNFKQIDRVGHYFNMASEEVHESLVESDAQLGTLVEALEAEVGPGRYVVIVTADHGQQPDEEAIGGYGIDPTEIRHDIDARFGKVVETVWPTEIFLDDEALEETGTTPDEVARYLADYRFADNTSSFGERLTGAGPFAPRDRLFDLAVASESLPELSCVAD